VELRGKRDGKKSGRLGGMKQKRRFVNLEQQQLSGKLTKPVGEQDSITVEGPGTDVSLLKNNPTKKTV